MIPIQKKYRRYASIRKFGRPYDGPSFSEIVQQTIASNAKEVLNNGVHHNALLSRLRAEGK